MHTLRRKSYSSLSDVRAEIIRDKQEKVVSFNGYELVTNRRVYGLFDGTVTYEDK